MKWKVWKVGLSFGPAPNDSSAADVVASKATLAFKEGREDSGERRVR